MQLTNAHKDLKEIRALATKGFQIEFVTLLESYFSAITTNLRNVIRHSHPWKDQSNIASAAIPLQNQIAVGNELHSNST